MLRQDSSKPTARHPGAFDNEKRLRETSRSKTILFASARRCYPSRHSMLRRIPISQPDVAASSCLFLLCYPLPIAEGAGAKHLGRFLMHRKSNNLYTSYRTCIENRVFYTRRARHQWLLMFQMSEAYSAIVRSLENLPVRATFKMALRVQTVGSRYCNPASRCAFR